MTVTVSPEDVERARDVLGGRIHRTPTLGSSDLGVSLKAELFQRTGSTIDATSFAVARAQNLKPPPTRALDTVMRTLEVGAKRVYSYSPRTKMFGVRATSMPPPTSKP